MITIIDYGIGNLRSIEKAFQRVGADVLRTDDVDEIRQADHLVLPGVGAFGACADEIRKRNLVEPIHEMVNQGIPFLGVCVGMQLLFDASEELGEHEGLGILPGRIVRFQSAHDSSDAKNGVPSTTLKVPHMGWNKVLPNYSTPFLDGIDAGAFFYFVHSFHAAPSQERDVLASTDYGISFPAIVARNNVFGVQFHPEKSQRNGLRILKNFAQM